jgi:hypothetical protein
MKIRHRKPIKLRLPLLESYERVMAEALAARDRYWQATTDLQKLIFEITDRRKRRAHLAEPNKFPVRRQFEKPNRLELLDK